MTQLRLNQLRPGMITAAEVRDQSGRLLLKAETALTENRIIILKTWGIVLLDVHCDQALAEVPEVEVANVSTANLQRATSLMEHRFHNVDRSLPAAMAVFRYGIDYLSRRLQSQDQDGRP